MAPPLISSVVNVRASTSGGTQAIPFSLNGLTPWFFAIIAYRTTLDDDLDTGTGTFPQQGASASWGCTDGTNEWANAVSAEDNVDPTDTYDWLRSDCVVNILDPADGTVDARAAFASWTANSVSITWSTTPGSEWRMVAIAWAGGGGSAEVGTATSNTSSGGTVDTSHSLGRAPRGFIATTGGHHTVVDSASANASGRFALGYGSWDGATIRQVCHSISLADGLSSTSQFGARASTDRILAPPEYAAADPGGSQPHVAITAVDDDSVTWTTVRESIPTSDFDFGYALLAGVECFAGIWELPTGTGSKTFDMPAGPNDLRPRGAFITSTRLQTSDYDATIITANRVATVGWGLAGSGLNSGSGNIVAGRLAYPSNTATYSDEHSLWHVHPHDQVGASTDAVLVSFDSDGLTVNSLTSNANALLMPILLVGAIHVSPTGLAVPIAFGEPTVELTQLLAPDGLEVPIAFGPPSLRLRLAPDGFDVPIAFGEPSLSLVVAPDGLAVPIAFGGPSLTLVLAPEGFAIPIAFGGPSLSLVLAPDGLEVPIVFGEPTLALTQLLAPDGLAIPIAFGSPTLTLVLFPDGFDVAIAFGEPSFRFTLAPDGLVVLIQFGSVTVSTGAFTAPWPAGQVVQGGPVAGMVTQSGAVMGQVVQGGPVAGQVSQGGAVVGNVVQGGSVAGQVGQGV